MQEFFGIPMGPFATVLAVLLGVLVAGIAALGLRNRVFLRLGVRNVRRRRARTSLIVLGLMLGTTIIAAALASGDTMTHTIRSSALQTYGATDVLVATKGSSLGSAPGDDYFSQDVVPTITRELLRSDHFDGVAPAVVETVSVQAPRTLQSEPRVSLFGTVGPNIAAFAPIEPLNGGPPARLEDLGANEVFVNEDAADELGVRAGDIVRVFAAEAAAMTVRDVVRFDGTGTDGAAVILGLERAQYLVGHPHEVKYILISGLGGALDGVRYTDELESLLAPTLDRLELESTPVKRDALEEADAEGTAFMSIFTTFGSFSIAAGILLIFLIFVMLAAERRGELGIARAIGTRRGHLVQMFVYEGLAYDLLAAAVGAALGVAVAFGMVFVLSNALGAEGVTIEHDVQLRSIVVAYALGVLLTFLVVALSAWRVSRMNIATAVRNLPEPPPRRARRRRWIGGIVLLTLGALLTLNGVQSAQALPFILGVSLVLVGAVPIARTLGVPERLAYTASGLALVAFCLFPFDWFDTLAGTDLQMSFSVWTASGLIVVVGAAWVLVYNADVLLGVAMALVGRVRALTPVLRMAMAYPLRARFRTGITLAMFTLVVFTLVAGAVISGSFIRAFDDLDTFGGGWDVRATAAPVTPLADPVTAVRGAPQLDGDAYAQVGSMSFLPVEAKQLETGRSFEEYPVRGVDDRFASHTTYAFLARARGFDDPWKALREQPNLAIVDAIVAPRRDDWSAGMVFPDFKLSGFYVEDGVFDPIPVRVRDPMTGRTLNLKVIGVLRDDTPYDVLGGITASQETLAGAFGERVRPTEYWLDLVPGVDARAEARKLESTFVANGLEAEALEETLENAVAESWTFNRLIQGFMGLGLVVGVAALGVISARAVVERRQQIGILRAIGFRKQMIQLSFLLESSFIALTAIVVGTFLALIVAVNVITDVTSNPNYADVALTVPWANLAIIFGAVYLVALLTTLAPAVRASRIYPAEALRYE
jgi:putative ABC transport system permease protein